MKGNTIQRKTVISVIIAVFLAFIFALCCLPKSKKASAYDGTFYFRGAPVVSSTATDGRYPLRYNLIVAEDALASTDSITITLSSNSSGAYVKRVQDGTTLTGTESASQSITFAYSVLIFDDGFASVYVDMYLNVYEKGRLTATCASTSAVSEEHTVVSAIEVALNDGTASPTLATIYDKYAGKDTTSDKGSLSFVSNIVPKTYTNLSPATLTAEFEFPANATSVLKNNYSIEVDTAGLTDGVAGTHYTVDCRYYIFSAVINAENPSIDGYGDLSSGVSRKNQYAGTAWSGFLYQIQNSSELTQQLKQMVYSNVNSSQPTGTFALSTSYGTLASLTGTESAKKTVEFQATTIGSTEDYYFYGEVLEYHWNLTYMKVGDNSPRLLENKRTIEAVYRSDVIKTSTREMSERILTENSTLNTNERNALCEWGGITATDEKPLEVISKTYSDSGNYQTQSSVYSISQANIYNKHSAINAMYNLTGITDVAHFNIVSTRRSYDSVTGNLYNMGDIIIRQALGYDYYYDTEDGKGYLTVEYNDFLYKDFYITIRNEENLQINYYTANVEVKDGVATLIFDYADIRERLYNSVKWIFEVNKDSFTITGSADVMLGVNVGEKDLRVSVPVKYQSNLFDLGIHAVATIVPDELYTVKYEYATGIDVSADGKDIELKTEMVSGGTLMLSRIINYNNYDIFMKEQGDMVEYSLKKFENKYGVCFAKVKDVYVENPDTVNKTVNILVTYDTNALFLVKNNLNDEWAYYPVSHSTNVYKGNEFVEAVGGIPNGYRVDDIVSGTNALNIDNAYDYNDTRAVLNAETHGSNIYPVMVNYTDKWFVSINWMQPYKDTPFAIKTKTDTEIRVLDYPDMYALTKEDVAKILGRKDLIITNVVQANAPKVSFDNVATYTVDITYGTASLKQIDYDGNINELKIPLTSYVDWCDSFGTDWTILFLNTKEKTYFQFDNDVAREDLYGFFATAVFEEQVSDLNYWFRNNTGDGQMTIFSSKSVAGSSLYAFFDNMTTKGIISKAIGTLGMMLCETIDDSNKMYHNYYFYLDGSTQNGYISNGGADDAFDDDGALENKGEDILNGITDKGKSWWDKFRESEWDTVVLVVLCVGGGLLLLGLLWKFGNNYVAWVTQKKRQKTSKKKRK